MWSDSSVSVSGGLGKDAACACVCACVSALQQPNKWFLLWVWKCRVSLCVCGNRCPPSGCWEATSLSTCVKWQWWTAGSPFNNSISFNPPALSPYLSRCQKPNNAADKEMIAPKKQIWCGENVKNAFDFFPSRPLINCILWFDNLTKQKHNKSRFSSCARCPRSVFKKSNQKRCRQREWGRSSRSTRDADISQHQDAGKWASTDQKWFASVC